MKLIHLSDLHIGKRVNEFSMLEDQKHILNCILDITSEQSPDAVIIAGDVYDKTVPPAEAVLLFDEFLFSLAKMDIPVFIISGNHDSVERLSFGSRLMEKSRVYISQSYRRGCTPVVLNDSFGTVNLYMLPFIKPVHVRQQFEDAEITSYSEAVRAAIEDMNIDTGKRNVLITHQFVTGAQLCDSEDITAGGTDSVSASLFDGFDYVALGHIHRPQSVTRDTLRYCGSPLKYSFSEADYEKSVTVVELKEKGVVNITLVPLVPLRDMREIKGTYDTLTARSFYSGFDTNDYMHITLTDEDDIFDAIGKLRVIYPNIMKLDYDNLRTRQDNTLTADGSVHTKSPFEIISEFYILQNNSELSEEQTAFITDAIEKYKE